MVTLYTLFVLIFNVISALSIVPDCNSLIISCPGNDPSCCQGPCCQFLHQYQTPQSIANPYYTNPYTNNYPRILTNTNPIPNIPSNPNIQSIIPQNRPTLNQACSTRFATPFQCAQGLQCKFTGQYNTNLYLLGQCKVSTEQTGCNYDDDCYRFNDKCINGRCTEPISFPPPIPPQMPPQAPPQRPPAPSQSGCGVNEVMSPCNGHCRPTCATGKMIACTMQCQRGCNCKDGYILDKVGGVCIAIDQCPSQTQTQPKINGGADPVSFSRAGVVADNLDDHETEIKGGNRNIPFSLSKQAQLVIGLLAFLCALCACYKCCSVLFELQRGSRKYSGSSYQSGARSDITAVDADIEWSDNSDSNESKDNQDNKDNEDDEDNEKDPENLLNVAVNDNKDKKDKKDKEQNPYAEYTDDYLL